MISSKMQKKLNTKVDDKWKKIKQEFKLKKENNELDLNIENSTNANGFNS